MNSEIDVSEKPDQFIAQKGRWMLKSELGADIPLSRYFTSVQIDSFNKEIHLTVLDVYIGGKPVIDEWVGKLLNGEQDELTLIQYDIDGNPMNDKVFSNIKLIGHKSARDYKQDDMFVEHFVMLQYKD
jgi:hypothetical protein